jgi:hypothetical protein
MVHYSHLKIIKKHCNRKKRKINLKPLRRCFIADHDKVITESLSGFQLDSELNVLQDQDELYFHDEIIDNQKTSDTNDDLDDGEYIQDLQDGGDDSGISLVSKNQEPTNYNQDIKIETINMVKVSLEERGIKDYFQSKCGGLKRPHVTSYIVHRVALLLAWTYQFFHLLLLPAQEVIAWFAVLITVEYELLEKFVSRYLDQFKGLSASTCSNYLCDISKTVNWFIYFRDNRRSEHGIDPLAVGGFTALLSILKKNFKPAIQKQKLANTLARMVTTNRFPHGGIFQLRQLLHDGLKWAESVSVEIITGQKYYYNKWISVLINAMYMFSSQGRIGGNYCYKY